MGAADGRQGEGIMGRKDTVLLGILLIAVAVMTGGIPGRDGMKRIQNAVSLPNERMGERGGILQVQAAESRRGEITVVYVCGSAKTPIPDAEFSIVPIADAKVEKESVTYTLKKEYLDGEEKLPDPMTPQFRENENIAGDLLKAYEKNGRKDAWIRKTNSEGRAVFSDCPAGIYLIWQSGGDGASSGYETALPFLAELPFRDSAEKKRVWERMVYPKTAARPGTGEEKEDLQEMTVSVVPPAGSSDPEPEPIAGEKPERGQGTGDDSAMIWYFLMMAGAAGLLGVWCRKHGKGKKG